MKDPTLDRHTADIHSLLAKQKKSEAALKEELHEALCSFPMRGRTLTAARRNQFIAFTQWLHENEMGGLEELLL